jgi:hypothetical protein
MKKWVYGLPTSSGGDGQDIVYQTSGDVHVLSPLTCRTMCWHTPTDDMGKPYTVCGVPRARIYQTLNRLEEK